MATSGSTNFSIDRDEIVRLALLNIGAISEGDDPNDDQLTDASQMLNLIVKAESASGMPLWAVKQTSFPLTATPTYTIGTGETVSTPRPLKIYTAFSRKDDIDQPIEVITREEYEELSSKASEGVPIKLYYDPQGGATAYGTINLWPSPDDDSVTNRDLYITYQRPFEDFDSSTDEPDFPQEWFLPIVWMLSWALCPMYGITKDERKQFLEEASILKKQVLDFGMEEGSFYVAPETR